MRRAALVLLLLGGLWLALQWARANPQHISFAPLKLSHPIGLATRTKLADLGATPALCHAILRDAGVRFDALPPVGDASCRADQRTRLHAGVMSVPLVPGDVAPSCPVAAGLLLWHRDVVSPLARAHLGQDVRRIDHFGSYSCRNIAGTGTRSEHATGNAIDIAGFILNDGGRVSVLRDWSGSDPAKRAFLRAVRDHSCDLFTTVLSPDYNAAHADHFHFDMADRVGSACR